MWSGVSINQSVCIHLCQFERYAYWTNMLLSHRRPVLIIGEVGVGKTSLIEVRINSFTAMSSALLCPSGN